MIGVIITHVLDGVDGQAYAHPPPHANQTGHVGDPDPVVGIVGAVKYHCQNSTCIVNDTIIGGTLYASVAV